MHDNRRALVDEVLPFGSRYYYLFDGLGSEVRLTASSGTLVATDAYDPYGNLTGSTGNVVNPWQYAAGNCDARTGYTKFGLCYYDQQTAR